MKTSLFLKLSVLMLVLLAPKGGVAAPFAIGSDNFSTAAIVPPEGGSSPFTDILEYTMQWGEPMLFTMSTLKTAWWRWEAPETGLCIVDTFSHFYSVGDSAQGNTFITAFEGSTLPTLRSVALSSFYAVDEGLGDPASTLSFYAQKGRVYYFQVGAYYLSDTSKRVRLTVSPIVGKAMRFDASVMCPTATGGKEPAGISVLVNPKGSLSGKVVLRSGTYPVKGFLDTAGYVRLTLTEKAKKGQQPQPPSVIRVRCVPNARAKFYLPNCFPIAVALYNSAPVPDVPEGTWAGYISQGPDLPLGSLSMQVKNKAVVMSMKTWDGTSFTYAGPFLYSYVYSNTAPSVAFMKTAKGGDLTLQADASVYDGVGLNRLFRSNGHYLKAAKPGAVFYPESISSPFSITSYPYVKPMVGQRAHGFLNASGGVGKLSVQDPTGELGGNVNLPLTLGVDNKFVFGLDAARKPALKLNVATGQITGSVILAGKKRNIVGTLSNPITPILCGYIVGTTKNVSFTVVP